MSRPIDADILKTRIREEYCPEYDEETEMEQIVDEQSTLDVSPVIHAHWKWDTGSVYRCSYCYYKSDMPDFLNVPEYQYCPSCGAKMDESVEE